MVDTVALNLKNREVELLAREVAEMSGQTLTESVRQALLHWRDHLRLTQRALSREARLGLFFAEEVWPGAPADELGRRMTGPEEDALLGYGPEGV